MSEASVFDRARAIADAVLYEGYILYPYRASAAKNQVRWQFGVVAPHAYAAGGGSDPWEMQTECLLEVATGSDARLHLRVRCLQLQARRVERAVDGGASEASFLPAEALEIDGEHVPAWDEGIERELDIPDLGVQELLETPRAVPLVLEAGRDEALVYDAAGALRGRIVRERWSVAGVVTVRAVPVADGSLVRLSVRIENRTPLPEPAVGRDPALRQALLGTHTLLAVDEAAFVSMLEPPASAAAAARACTNRHTWPVLVGDHGARTVVLSSPIILYDYPAVAPESVGELYDATEIDEILSLRVLTLTDAEKREARGTDARARRIVDRTESLSAESFARLHGTIRSRGRVDQPGLGPVVTAAGPGASPRPWPRDADASWGVDLGPDAALGQDAGAGSVTIGSTTVTRGSRVVLRPRRRADAMDLFLAGRWARVEGVYLDVDGVTHVAVTVEDDPGAGFQREFGRFFYFRPDEIDPASATVDRARRYPGNAPRDVAPSMGGGVRDENGCGDAS